MSQAARRRVGGIEAALPVMLAIRHWLAEAFGFESLPTYVDWIMEQPLAHAPLARIPAQVEASVRSERKWSERRALDQAIRSQVRSALFLVELVLATNVLVEAELREGWLRLALLHSDRRVIELQEELEASRKLRRSARLDERETAWSADAQRLVNHLASIEAAVANLEHEHLEGTDMLFPVLRADLDAYRQSVTAVTAGTEATPSPVPDAASEIAARLVATARAQALDLLGEKAAAVGVMRRHFSSSSATT